MKSPTTEIVWKQKKSKNIIMNKDGEFDSMEIEETNSTVPIKDGYKYNAMLNQEKNMKMTKFK